MVCDVYTALNDETVTEANSLVKTRFKQLSNTENVK